MKRKTILIVMWGLIFLATVSVAQVALTRTDSKINISQEDLETLQRTNGITDINIVASEITCNNENCWVDLKQEGFIDIRMFLPVNKTASELKTLRDKQIEEILKEYAEAQRERETRKDNEVKIDSGGTITRKT